jgi:hypothetical protein
MEIAVNALLPLLLRLAAVPPPLAVVDFAIVVFNSIIEGPPPLGGPFALCSCFHLYHSFQKSGIYSTSYLKNST